MRPGARFWGFDLFSLSLLFPPPQDGFLTNLKNRGWGGEGRMLDLVFGLALRTTGGV